MAWVKVNPEVLRLEQTGKSSGGRVIWRHLQTILYSVKIGSNPPFEFAIQEGDETDLGSIPNCIPPCIVGSDEPWNIAYAVHDDICNKKVLPWKYSYQVLYELCREKGAPKWKALLIKYAVRFKGPKW
jgi:hypothetical protein